MKKELNPIYPKATNLNSKISTPSVVNCKTRYIFLLSHMRSRSSVLSHVIGSNIDTCGYCEFHRSYFDYSDFIKLQINLHKEFNCKLHDKYIFDKILHNSFTVSNRMLEIVKPKIIFLLRDPKNTIKSIINMGYLLEKNWYKSPQKALDYYCSRLLFIKKFAKKLGKNFFYIESDDLIDNTKKTLNSLTNWLNLSEPLKSKYSIFNKTGKPGFGDPSNNIKIGFIKRTPEYKNIEIPLHILQTGESLYKICKDSLLKNSHKENNPYSKRLGTK